MKSYRAVVAAPLLCAACLLAGPPARAVVTGTVTSITDSYSPTAGPWVATTLCGTWVWWSRTITWVKVSTTTSVPVTWPSRWHEWTGTAPTATGGPTVTVAAPVTVTTTENQFFGSSIFPPGAAPPPPRVVTRPDPPPENDPANYFYEAGQRLAIPTLPAAADPSSSFADNLALIGAGYLSAADSIAALLGDLAAVDDPMGLKARFQSDLGQFQAGLGAIGSELTSGIPTSGALYEQLGDVLRELAIDFALIPESRYGVAALELIAAADALDDAALSAPDLAAGCSTANPCRIKFVQDLEIVSDRLQQFAVDLAVPEPGGLPLAGLALALAIRVRRRVRRG